MVIQKISSTSNSTTIKLLQHWKLLIMCKVSLKYQHQQPRISATATFKKSKGQQVSSSKQFSSKIRWSSEFSVKLVEIQNKKTSSRSRKQIEAICYWTSVCKGTSLPDVKLHVQHP